MCALLHGFVQADMWMHRVCWPTQSASFAAGQARGNASQICDRFPAPNNEGTCQGDGKGVGSSQAAYQAIARYCGGHLYAMDIACCTALGVPDTPVQRLQAIPVPKEEAWEDANTDYISFHVYEYKTLLRKDGKEQRRLEHIQKHCKIGEFHHIHYWPALGCGRYHMTSYLLAARCRKERRTMSCGSISSHRECHCPSTTKYRANTTKTAL
jgi:hypothetical protein